MRGGVTTTRRRQRRQLATGSSWAFGATNAANPMLFHSKRATMGLGVRMASLWLAKKKGYRVRGAHRGLGTVYFYCCWCVAALCNLQPDGPCPKPVISRSLYIRHLWLWATLAYVAHVDGQLCFLHNPQPGPRCLAGLLAPHPRAQGLPKHQHQRNLRPPVYIHGLVRLPSGAGDPNKRAADSYNAQLR